MSSSSSTSSCVMGAGLAGAADSPHLAPTPPSAWTENSTARLLDQAEAQILRRPKREKPQTWDAPQAGGPALRRSAHGEVNWSKGRLGAGSRQDGSLPLSRSVQAAWRG